MGAIRILGRSGGGVPVDLINPDNFESFLATTLNIPTPDANTNVAHPSAIYIKDGWNGYTYWLAFTPYPTEIRENPCILHSNDGVTWTDESNNPVEPVPEGGAYNSDVDLVYREDEQKMYLFWRFQDATNSDFFYKTSTDGVNWIDKTRFFRKLKDKSAVPCLVYKSGVWHFWYNSLDGGFAIKHLKASSIDSLQSASEDSCIIPSVTGYHVWHMDINWDSRYKQYIGIMTYCLDGAQPNNDGIFRIMTSLDGITWSVSSFNLNILSSAAYRGSFIKTDYSDQNGAAFELIANEQWKIRRAKLYLKTTGTAKAFDGISEIEAIYGLKYRISSWNKLPVALVTRVSDNAFVDVYPTTDNLDLELADGTSLITWANESVLKVSRLYNQVNKEHCDFMEFSAFPVLSKTTWNNNTNWGLTFNGVDTFASSRTNENFKAVTVSAKLTSGKIVGIGSAYLGLIGNNIQLLLNTNINTWHEPYPATLTGILGASNSAKIRRNSLEIASGSTNDSLSLSKRYLGNRTSSGVPVAGEYLSGVVNEFVFWGSLPSDTNLNLIESTLTSDYPYVPAIKLNDTFTDVAGILITAHAPNVGTGNYTANDSLWEIKSGNKLGRISAGTGTPLAIFDAGISDGVVSVDVTPGSTGGSGLVVRYVDNNNYVYFRVFNRTTLGILRYVAGSIQNPNNFTIPDYGPTYTIKVKLIGTLIIIYVNNVFVGSYTEPNFTTAIKYGVFCATNEPTTVFDNLSIVAW